MTKSNEQKIDENISLAIHNIRLPQGPILINLISPPGAGKGTLCSNFKKHYDVDKYVSSDALREYVHQFEDSTEAQNILRAIKEGRLVEDRHVLGAFARKIPELYQVMHAHQKPLIFDGLVRTPEQASAVDFYLRGLDHNHGFDITVVIDISDKLAIERMLFRGISGLLTDGIATLREDTHFPEGRMELYREREAELIATAAEHSEKLIRLNGNKHHAAVFYELHAKNANPKGDIFFDKAYKRFAALHGNGLREKIEQLKSQSPLLKEPEVKHHVRELERRWNYVDATYK